MFNSESEANLLEFSIHPPKGWLRYKRDKFGITGPQLAAKMGVTKQRISALEKAELSGAASLKTMRQAAAALGCDFVYALVPKGSLHSNSSPMGYQQLDPLECMQEPQSSNQVIEICNAFDIVSLGLYGSAARGEMDEGSDINILAEFGDLDALSDAKVEQIEIQFGRLFSRKVEVVSQQVLEDPVFVDAIIADLKLIYLN